MGTIDRGISYIASGARRLPRMLVHRTDIRRVAVSRYAEPMARLIEELKKLPGVGTKTAQRFAFHILRSNDDDASALAEAVRGLKASLRLCSICNNITDVDPCVYCTSPRAISGWSAWWKSLRTSMRWSARTLQRRVPRAARDTLAPARRGAGPAPRPDAWSRASSEAR